MARVAFFTERLPPDPDPIAAFSYGLMHALAEQQHEVQVYSTYREGSELPPAHSGLTILRPFRKWSWLEIPRLIPLLVSFKPQILHIIEPHAQAMRGLTNAMSALPALKPMIGKPRIVTTYYDLQARDLPTHRLLLTSSDLVTVTNSSQAELVGDYCRTLGRRRPEIEILPVPSLRQSSLNSTVDRPGDVFNDPAEHLREFIDKQEKMIFIPGDIDRHLSVKILFQILAETLRAAPSASVLFGGGWGSLMARRRHELMEIFENAELGARVFVSGPISEEVELLCLERASLLFMASLTPESLSLTRLLRSALISNTPPLMSESQANLDALPWRDDEHAFFSGETPQSWKFTLRRALRSPDLLKAMKNRLPEFARLQTLDLPANVMSRLYTRLLDRSLDAHSS